MKYYTLIILSKYDDVPELHYVTADEILNITEQLTKWDYAIIDGVILKTFDDGSFNIKGLK